MDNYFLNGQNLKELGIIPGIADGSNIALSGAWDMPARIGKTHHVWDEEDGLEPYLRADEIFFGGRDLSYTFLLEAASKEAAIKKAYDLFDAIGAFTSLVPFRSDDFGTWDVRIGGQIRAEYLGDGWCRGVIPFRQPVVDLSGVIPSADDVSPSIDKISLGRLGLILLESNGEFNRPDIKAANLTAYGYEGYRITKRSFRELQLSFLIDSPDYTTFETRIKALYALFSSPNARTLNLDKTTREFFVKDGFRVTNVCRYGARHVAQLELTLAEIRVLDTWNKLTDISGLVLTDASGVPITEILKMR